MDISTIRCASCGRTPQSSVDFGEWVVEVENEHGSGFFGPGWADIGAAVGDAIRNAGGDSKALCAQCVRTPA